MSDLLQKLITDELRRRVKADPLFESDSIGLENKEVTSTTLEGFDLPPRHRVTVKCDGSSFTSGLNLWRGRSEHPGENGGSAATIIYEALVKNHPQVCPKCSERRKLEGDYLCEGCRYG